MKEGPPGIILPVPRPGAERATLPVSNLGIQEQATQVVNNKRLKDTWEASSHARGCGCPSCGRRYQGTLDFYAALGSVKPNRETPSRYRSPGGIHWSNSPYGRWQYGHTEHPPRWEDD